MNKLEVHKFSTGKVKYYNLTKKQYIAKGAEFKDGDMEPFGEYFTSQILDAIGNDRVVSFCNTSGNVCTPAETLAMRKSAAKISVNKKTEKILTAGFEYDGKVFSLDTDNRTNYLAIYTNSKGTGAYNIPALDIDANPYPFNSAAEVENWFQFGFAFGNVVYSSGMALKNQINNSLSVEELETYVDTRTSGQLRQDLINLLSQG